MSPGPLRRLMGMLGLMALAPTAIMLALEQIGPLDAALRGTATLVASTVVGRTAGWWVALIARGLERPEAGDRTTDMPKRRRDDAEGVPAHSR